MNGHRRSAAIVSFLWLVGVAFLLAGTAPAQTTFTWTGGGTTTNWSDAGNWGGTAPNGPTSASGGSQTLTLGLPGATAPVVDLNAPWFLGGLQFAANSGDVSLTGNALTITTTTGVNAGVAGTFNDSIANNITFQSNFSVVKSGASSGGNLAISGNLIEGTGTSTLTLRGSGTHSSVSGIIGGSGSGTLTLQKVDAGTWTLSNGANRIGAFNILAGTLVIGASGALGASPTVNMGQATTTIASTIDLQGHSQTLSGLAVTAPTSGSAADIITSTATGGALTYAKASGSDTFGGQLTGSLSLTKQGAGTLILAVISNLTSSGQNTYTGATTVSAGTLALSGGATLSGTSGIAVASGATFDVSQNTSGFTLGVAQTLSGSGTVENTGLVLSVAGTLSPGTSGAGTLTIHGGTVAFGSTSRLAFTLGSAADAITLTGSTGLDLGSGTLGFGDFTWTAGTGFGLGTYTLIGGASSLAGSLDGADLSGTIGGMSATLGVSGNNLVLNVVPEPASAALAAPGLGLLVLAWAFRRRSASALE